MEEIEFISNETISIVQSIMNMMKQIFFVEEKIRKVKEINYEGIEDEDIKQQLSKIETYYDIVLEVECRCDQLLSERNKIYNHLEEYQRIVNNCFVYADNKQKEIHVKTQRAFEKIKSLEKILKEKNEDDEIKNEKDEDQNNRNEEFERINNNEKNKNNKVTADILSIEEQTMISQTIGRECDHILFDTNKNQWNLKESELHSQITHKSNVLFVIETSTKKKIGCYINSTITEVGKYIEDKNAFIFKFDCNQIYKYPIIDYKNAIYIGNNDDKNLFIVGYNWGLFSKSGDIVIRKEELKDKCICEQTSFQYNKPHSLIGKQGNFSINRIVAIQMKLSKEDYLKKVQLYGISLNQINILENWTQKKVGDIIFDTVSDDWEDSTSILNNRIEGKRQLIFLVEDKKCQKFGYYHPTDIHLIHQEWLTPDETAFMFNLESNGRLKEPIKFEIKQLHDNGCFFHPKRSDHLISFGEVVLYKRNKSGWSYCCQTNEMFDYHSIEKALCGRNLWGDPFGLKRLTIISMN